MSADICVQIRKTATCRAVVVNVFAKIIHYKLPIAAIVWHLVCTFVFKSKDERTKIKDLILLSFSF